MADCSGESIDRFLELRMQKACTWASLKMSFKTWEISLYSWKEDNNHVMQMEVNWNDIL